MRDYHLHSRERYHVISKYLLSHVEWILYSRALITGSLGMYFQCRLLAFDSICLVLAQRSNDVPCYPGFESTARPLCMKIYENR